MNIKVDNMQHHVPDVRGRVERLYVKSFKTENSPGEGVFCRHVADESVVTLNGLVG